MQYLYKIKKKLITYILLFLVILVPVITFILIHHYAVNVPFDDQYAMIPMIKSVLSGHIPFAALWAQHNEHRIFFPNVILLFLAMITRWSIIDEMYLSFIISCIGFTGLAFILRRHIKNTNSYLLALLLSAAIFFSSIQWQNWLWGWQLEWFLCLACILWSINLIDRLDNHTKLQNLIIPGLIAFIATFSLSSGMLGWFVCLAILIIRKFRSSQQSNKR